MVLNKNRRKTTLYTLILFSLVSLSFAQEINWISAAQASKELKKYPTKKLYFFVYADWCGYCKKMESETYKDAKITAYINKNYIPVKFDAETKENINFLGINYTYIKEIKVNYLTYYLGGSRLGYPAAFILDNRGKIKETILGFKTPEEILSDLESFQ